MESHSIMESHIELPNIETTIEFLYPETEQENFGIYNLIVPDKPILFKTIHWILNVDVSGSMSNKCKDGKTKIEQIKHTMKNMLDYFLTFKDIKQHITLIAFDDEIKIISYNEEINENYITTFNKTLIHKFQPENLTDIGIALDSAADVIRKIQQTQEPLNKIVHILLTDGQITKGEQDNYILKNKVVIGKNISNVFIGFGTDHSAILLEHLADQTNCEYYFIESLEKAGMVYGEIIYNNLYEAIRNLTIKIEHGDIYDYKTNTWGASLNVGNIPFGTNRTWHIKTTENIRVRITASYDSIINPRIEYDYFTILSEYPILNTINKKVEKYKWRQQTQELLHETKNYIKLSGRQTNKYRYSHIMRDGYLDDDDTKINQEKVLIKRLDDFMLLLKSYIEINNLQNDEFMKSLTDDIYISIRSITSTKGYLYTSARFCSQGAQRAYNMTDYEELINKDEGYDNLSIYTQSYETSHSSTTTYSPMKTAELMSTLNAYK